MLFQLDCGRDAQIVSAEFRKGVKEFPSPPKAQPGAPKITPNGTICSHSANLRAIWTQKFPKTHPKTQQMFPKWCRKLNIYDLQLPVPGMIAIPSSSPHPSLPHPHPFLTTAESQDTAQTCVIYYHARSWIVFQCILACVLQIWGPNQSDYDTRTANWRSVLGAGLKVST